MIIITEYVEDEYYSKDDDNPHGDVDLGGVSIVSMRWKTCIYTPVYMYIFTDQRLYSHCRSSTLSEGWPPTPLHTR